jgi:hypothetical protein
MVCLGRAEARGWCVVSAVDLSGFEIPGQACCRDGTVYCSSEEKIQGLTMK